MELSDDPAFSRRIVRLLVTSAVVLGLLWDLARGIANLASLWEKGLLWGWVLMPTILGLSLRWPRLRYALMVPSFLVSVSLLGLCCTALPREALAAAGWILVTTGVLLGGVLGIWFWFRWLPVPNGLDQPFSRGRWTLVVIHISLIVIGLGCLALPKH